jgi:hypothetical protein
VTAPTYRLCARINVHRTGFARWAWEVTDGLVGPLLASGTTWTRGGAEVDGALAAAGCEPCLALQMERVADRLRREGLPVVARLDEQDRVCVRPLCACSDVDHRRVMRAFLAITRTVRWEGSR